ncbi:Glu/Leu/Phe/Val dehydrogenase [Synechococcus sp. PCC 7336]|uniref:Glu/Leu/Phe/Val family dehydrogenase n=1 Tax=Synechococcus sp. PCC 7336 TaxID=195250 RepID=UPI00034ADC94|nr:Glu/Leu/Phe/Val dehydrogenase [Synechococcus sp. PCC 7336]
METIFRFADDLGPAKIVHLYDPRTGLKAILAIDNVALGAAIGGVRMAPDVTTEEVFRLARAMTLKNAAANLPHGGGKAAILADPKLPRGEKEQLMRAFARAIAPFTDYIPGPDMGTDEQCMAWVYGEMGRAIGLPAQMGGIPLDEIGATGFGLAIATEVATGYCDVELEGARVVVQGFGSVGQHVAKFLAEKGAILVGVTDSQGTLFDPDGIDVAMAIALKRSGRSVIDLPRGKALDRDGAIDIECEIWIPAARPDVVRLDNIDRLQAKLVVQGANIPFTAAAEEICHAQNILVIPDFIANAGGVICGAVEYRGGTQADAFEAIEREIRVNTAAMLDEAVQAGRLPRHVAIELARSRIRARQDNRMSVS